MVKANTVLVIGGLAVAGLVAYFLFGRSNQGGSSVSTPIDVQTPQSITPSAASLFNSRPDLTTGGSGSGNFTLLQTYSPYYSTTSNLTNDYTNTYTNTTTTTTTSNPQVKLFSL